MAGGDVLSIAGLTLREAFVAPLFVAACTAVAKLAWAGMSTLMRYVRFRIDQVIVKRTINLTWLIQELRSNNLDRYPIFCLIIRFARDEYLSHLASDQDRYEGRLLNRVVTLDVDDSGKAALGIPVHRRLGTQFKLYFLTDSVGSAGKLWLKLKNTAVTQDEESSDNPSQEIILDDKEPLDRRVWFRLAAYGTAKTIEGHQNSFFEPTRVAAFESENAFKSSIWSGQSTDDYLATGHKRAIESLAAPEHASGDGPASDIKS